MKKMTLVALLGLSLCAGAMSPLANAAPAPTDSNAHTRVIATTTPTLLSLSTLWCRILPIGCQ